MGRTGRHLLPVLTFVVVAACAPRKGQDFPGSNPGPPAPAPASSALLDAAPGPDPAVLAPTGRVDVPDGGASGDGSAASDVRPFLRTNFGVTTDPANPPPPVSGGTLTVLAGSKLAVASDPDRDHVVVADLVGWKVAFDVALRPHDEPGRVVEGPPGSAYVALRRGGAVVTIDTGTGAITERRAVCSAPRGLAFDGVNGLLHVACAGGELVSLPAVGGPEARRLSLDADLRDVVSSGANLYVSRFRSAEILTVSAAGVVTSRTVPTPLDKTFAPGVAWRLRTMPTGEIVMVLEGGVKAAVAIGGATSPTPAPAGSYASSAPCTDIVTTMVTVFTPELTQSSYFVSGIVLPVDLAIDARSGSPVVIHAAAANTPSMALTVGLVDVGTTRANQCQAPAMLGLPMGARPPGQLVAVDSSDSGSLFVQTREPATLWRDDGRTLTLSTESHADVGHALFHADVNGIACASCHPEGGEDGRVWKFTPIGLRRTPSLRGGIGGTEPFHWDGDLPTLSGLMSEVFVRRMGGPTLAPDQVDDLYRWINAVPALPGVVVDAAAVARGRALFLDPQVGCAACHAGALLTNNATVDVGTGQAFQVPSLRGVGWRAPYMHDGCAATLADRFVPPCGGGEMHGHTAGLTPANVADLVSYLRSI
jgi:hypothetical protein